MRIKKVVRLMGTQVTLNDPLFIEWHIRFTMVLCYLYLSNNVEEIIVDLTSILVRQEKYTLQFL